MSGERCGELQHFEDAVITCQKQKGHADVRHEYYSSDFRSHVIWISVAMPLDHPDRLLK